MAKQQAGIGNFAKPKEVVAPEAKADRAEVQKKFVVDSAVASRIKVFCAQQNMTQQEFMTEAVSLMFKSKGLPGI